MERLGVGAGVADDLRDRDVIGIAERGQAQFDCACVLRQSAREVSSAAVRSHRNDEGDILEYRI
jgi:hypothetical protein